MKVKEKYYLTATKEFDAGQIETALWSKAMTQSEGDESKAKYKYIEQRAAQLHSQTESIFQFKAIQYLAFLPIFIATFAGVIIIFGLDPYDLIGWTFIICGPTLIGTLFFEWLLKDPWFKLMNIDESEKNLNKYRSTFRFICSMFAGSIILITALYY